MRKKILVIGNSSNDLAMFAGQQLDLKCFSQFDIVCYSATASAHDERGTVHTFGLINWVEEGLTSEHYHILITIGVDVIQRLAKVPSYEEMLLWDIADAKDVEEQQAAITEHVNYFLSRHFY
jgi:hypothetical protein